MSELDFEVNRRAESAIRGLSRKLNLLDEKIGDVENLLPGGNRRETAPYGRGSDRSRDQRERCAI